MSLGTTNIEESDNISNSLKEDSAADKRSTSSMFSDDMKEHILANTCSFLLDSNDFE